MICFQSDGHSRHMPRTGFIMLSVLLISESRPSSRMVLGRTRIMHYDDLEGK